MPRTRPAILEAAAGCVERDGVRKMMMGQLAPAAGVAKSTLYNHFRTKDAVLAALVEARVAALAAECVVIAGGDAGPRPDLGRETPDSGAGRGLQAALAHAAAGLAGCRPLRRVAAEDPALLLPLVVPGDGRGWFQARAAVGEVLAAAGQAAAPEAVDVVLRWLVGQLLWPITPAQAQREAALLARGPAVDLPAAAPAPAIPAPAIPADSTPGGGSGLGWPG